MFSIETLKEFFRYILVGGSAFLIDTGVLYLVYNFIFFDMGQIGLFISVAIGFMLSVIYNYILSLTFVFKSSREKYEKPHIKDFVLFLIIGITGLIFTEIGMYVGVSFISPEYYLGIKVLVSILVMFWNYIVKKIFIFNKKIM